MARDLILPSPTLGNQKNPNANAGPTKAALNELQARGRLNPSFEQIAPLISTTDSILHHMSGSHTIHHQEEWQAFNRYYAINPETDEISTGRQYVFLVRPECNLVSPTNRNMLANDDLKNDGFWNYMLNAHGLILRSLTMELTADHDFIPYLTGRTEMLQIPDYTLKAYNLIQPYTHYSMPYGGNMIESQTGGTFDITFRDDGQFRLHKLFQAWLYYIDGVSRNKFSPKDKFITYNKIDYATSVYHFIMDPTNTYIQWWSKYTGCIPTAVSNSDLSWNKGGTFDGKFSVPFNYFYHESLNPQILADFNTNSINSGYTVAPTYDEDYMTSGDTYVGAPYVASDSQNHIILKWRKPQKEYKYI